MCTDVQRYIACRDGSNILVTKVFWGRTSDTVCPSDDGDPVTDCSGSSETLALVKTKCDTKKKCILIASEGR